MQLSILNLIRMNAAPSSLVSVFGRSIIDNWEFPALADYNGVTYAYKDVAEKILRIHAIFRAAGIKKGEKVALLGKNSANWGIIYIATVTYGAVIVPILPDFRPDDVQYIINHSDSVILFSEESLFKELDQKALPAVRFVIRIQDLSILQSDDTALRGQIDQGIMVHEERVKKGISPEDIRFDPGQSGDIAVISYTSGTTGFSKGVVLQHKSLLGNILYAHRNMPLNPKDKILSFLPLAHTYGCAFEFLFPFTLGCDITFLTKTPSPKIIMQAFQEIRPALILSVPLVIEKIYKSQLIPALRKPR